MRRFLTTLMILLVVIVAGLSALVLLVNPNDFRYYMVNQVEQRSGYQLNLEGSLRWHVWPRLSILTGRMSLKAPGAEAPLVSAENMRLDVALLPLISHQLQVRQVLLKNAVVQLTPQTEARRAIDAPVGPKDSIPSPIDVGHGWSFDIASLQVVDSLLVFQHADDEQMTVRNINIQMDQNDKHQAHVELSGRINRDQRDLNLSLQADVDASQYPQNLTSQVNEFHYQLTGADLPAQGISGQGSFQAIWQEPERQLSVRALKLAANDSAINGELAVVLNDRPSWQLALTSQYLNLDNLLSANAANSTPVAVPNGDKPAQTGRLSRPVIAGGIEPSPYHNLQGFDADMQLNVGALRFRGLDFSHIESMFSNRQGLLQIEKLQGYLGKGFLSLPAELDARQVPSTLSVTPSIKDVAIGPILHAFNYPLSMNGELSVEGQFTGNKFSAEDFQRHWQGNADLTIRNSRLEGMNFQQLIQQAVTRSNSSVQAHKNYSDATELEKVIAKASLDRGVITFDELAGHSNVMDLTGTGTLDLVKQEADTQMNIIVNGGWEGDSKLIDALKTTSIPLRVYGPWQGLKYHLQVDQILRKQLQDEAKRRLRDWADRNQDDAKAKDLKKLLDKM